MLRSTVALLFAALCSSCVSAAPSAPATGTATRPRRPAPTFVISGRGWGHGVGMSQWGAYGFAPEAAGRTTRSSRTTTAGTTLGQRARVARVRVLLGERAARGDDRVDVRRSRVRATDDKRFTSSAAGSYAFGPGLQGSKVGRASSRQRSPGPLALRRAARRRSRSAAKPYRGSLEVERRRSGAAARDQRGRARGVPLRRRPARDAARLARRGAQGAGRRRALVRARRAHAPAPTSTSTPTRAARSTAASRPRSRRRPRPSRRPPARCSCTRARSRRRSSSRPRAGAPPTSRTSASGPPVPYLVSVPDPYDTISPLPQLGPVPASRPRRSAKALGVARHAARRAGRRRTRPSASTTVTAARRGGRGERDAGPSVRTRARAPLDLVPRRRARARPADAGRSSTASAAKLTGLARAARRTSCSSSAPSGGAWERRGAP